MTKQKKRTPSRNLGDVGAGVNRTVVWVCKYDQQLYLSPFGGYLTSYSIKQLGYAVDFIYT